MDNTIRPTLMAYPFTIFLLVVLSLVLKDVEGEGGLVFFFIFFLPVALLFLISYRGNKYEIKNGVIKHTDFLSNVKSLKLDSVLNIEVKRKLFGSGNLILTTAGAKLTLKNIPRAQALADKLTGFS